MTKQAYIHNQVSIQNTNNQLGEVGKQITSR